LSGKHSAHERATFAAAKFLWLRAIATDARLGHLAVRVGLLLSENASLSTGIAWRSQEVLAEWCGGVTDRAVRNALGQLIAHDYLDVFRSGARQVNRYCLVLDGEPVTGSWLPLTDRNEASSHEASDRNEASAHDEHDGKFGDGDRNDSSCMTGSWVPPTSFKNLSEDTFLHIAGEHARDVTPRSPAREARPDFEPGEHVQHNKHGLGIIAEVETDSRYPGQPYLVVDFDSGRQRVLATVVTKKAFRGFAA
jgi:hypothetical protein